MKCSIKTLALVEAVFFSAGFAAPHPQPDLEPRATDDISSCGSRWMPRDDVSIGGGTDTRTGFNTAVDKFCNAVKGQTVSASGYLSMATEVYLNGGNSPATYGAVGFVYFEVHNKISSSHVIDYESCRTYLRALSADGGECSGEVNIDTKGGTWQVGNNGISYHALGEELPPKQDALNKLYTGGAIGAQSANKGGSAPLSPWPHGFANAIKPVACHSHNDYDRAVPIFSAMAVGCVGFEVDVWYFDDDVIIGHILPLLGRTMKAQYVDPLRAILDYNNGKVGGDIGLYPASPSQSITLLVDFKTSDSRTLDTVVSSLQPLRDAGYLSYFDGTNFVERQVTVVASGKAPFDRIKVGDGVPDRDVFFDAHVDYWDTEFTKLNSYYASADFQDAIGNPGSVSAFTQAQQDTVASQVATAHAAGLKVRYYNLPGNYMWEPLADLGVDRLNADDMYDTARLPRI